MNVRALSVAALLIGVSVAPMLAHHDVVSTYDAGKVTTITGLITRMEWTNPHVWIYMNVRGAAGKDVAWRIQIAAPNALDRAGIKKELLDLNRSCTMEIWPAFKEETIDYKTANGRLLTYPDGRKFDVSDKWPNTKLPG